MRVLFLIALSLFGLNAAKAHTPDISSIMIYEQNGKNILLIKSSLTAFEGEIDYRYKKNAYKTPQEFVLLVEKHFREKCFVIVNADTVRFSNFQVQLGHETTVFAELDSMPKDIQSLFVKNALFEDMHNNKSELILTTNGLPLKQYILENNNDHSVLLNVEQKNWVVQDLSNPFYRDARFLITFGSVLVAGLIAFLMFRQKRVADNADGTSNSLPA